MSTEATPTAAPAPVEQSAPAPETPAVETPKPGPQSAKEARQARKDRLAGRLSPEPKAAAPEAPATTPTQDERGNLHGDAGRFVEKSDANLAAAVNAGSKPATEPQAGERSPEETAAPTATTEVPEGHVRIELPEGHPLRDRGWSHVDAPAGKEQEYRWAFINNATRKAEVERATQEIDSYRTRLDQIEAENVRLNAQLRAQTESRESLLKDPTVLQNYQVLKEADPAVAEAYLRGVEAEHGPKVEEYVREAETQRQQRRHEEAGIRFRQQVVDAVRSSPVFDAWHNSPALEAKVDEALDLYLASLRRRPRQATVGDLLQGILGPLYASDPAVQQTFRQRASEQQAAERQRIEAEARQSVEAEAKRREEEALRQAATTRRQNPLASVGAGTHTGHGAPDDSPRTAREARDARKARIRGALLR